MIKLKNILSELEWKKVIRNKKLVRKAICPPGKKFDPRKKQCVTIKGSEKQKMAKRAKKAALKRKAKMGKIIKKRQKSMAKRRKQIR
tara:strand:+ start:1642 stop:1902 length:261 start_codon:yes stop_codon:yes gene_type:complete